MLDFLRNLALLGVIAILLFIVAPDVMRQILGIYNGLGILPIVAVLILLAALSRKTRRRRR